VAIRRTGPNGAIRLTLELEGQDKVDLALSRFGRDVRDWRPFWRDALAPKFFQDVQSNFDREGKMAHEGGWKPLAPGYAAWKRRNYPGKKILERTLKLRRSLTWRGSLFSPGGGRGNLGPGGIFRPTPDSVELGTSVPYAKYHQQGGQRRTGMRGGRRGSTGRFIRTLPQRKFLFFVAGTRYGRILHRWVLDTRDAAGLGGNRYGTGGRSGGGEEFTA
jgi:phage gpG-like protein